MTVIMITGMAFWMSATTAHALPEYATRTGESCAACHVSAGGGGPRTLRGLLWAARGRPDKVPALPNMLIAPRTTEGAELYDIACAGCHGLKGEGLFAIELIGTGIGPGATRTFILDGIATFGMPSFEGQFTDSQLKTLVTYVVGLGNGSLAPPLDKYPLQPGRLKCLPPACGPLTSTSKGN
jgi:mono/diheme cytochrome c family protein